MRCASPDIVPFDDLPALYTLAEMFVFPSLYEGFGLPVIEAMACGVPVVTGDVAALNEVAGNAVERVESLDAESLGDVMVRWRGAEHGAKNCSGSVWSARVVLVAAGGARNTRRLP